MNKIVRNADRLRSAVSLSRLAIMLISTGVPVLTWGVATAASNPATPESAVIASRPLTVADEFAKISAPSHGNGYSSAEVELTYRFLICSNTITLAYNFAPDSAKTSAVYWLNGNQIGTGQTKIRVATIEFNGVVFQGQTAINQFSDHAVKPASGDLGCTSQMQKVGLLSDYLGPKATLAQKQSFVDSLVLQIAPMSGSLIDSAREHPPAPVIVSTPVDAPVLATSVNAIPASPAASSNSKAVQDYMEQIQQSQQALADFKIKRAEYETELQAARDARARYEQQYGSNPQH